jgi:hypothetical protein
MMMLPSSPALMAIFDAAQHAVAGVYAEFNFFG